MYFLKGFGTNPPMIKPKPLSIQSEMNSITQARASVFSFFLMAGNDQHQERNDRKDARRPHHGHELAVAVKAGIKIIERMLMTGIPL